MFFPMILSLGHVPSASRELTIRTEKRQYSKWGYQIKTSLLKGFSIILGMSRLLHQRDPKIIQCLLKRQKCIPLWFNSPGWASQTEQLYSICSLRNLGPSILFLWQYLGSGSQCGLWTPWGLVDLCRGFMIIKAIYIIIISIIHIN